MVRVVPLLFVLACGPITYVQEVTRGAADGIEEARAAEADKYSPYYWTRAVEYYRKAKELAAHADFQAANRYGRLASEAAELAVNEAREAAKDPSKRPKEPEKKRDTAPAPAKDQKDLSPAKEGGETAPSQAPASPGRSGAEVPSTDPATPDPKKQPAPTPTPTPTKDAKP